MDRNAEFFKLPIERVGELGRTLFNRIDGIRSVDEISALARAEPDYRLRATQALDVFRRLYLADMIDLRVTHRN